MSGALTAFRVELKAALTGQVLADGIPLVVQDVLPEASQPPALLITPSDPFLVPGKNPAGRADTHWEVLAVLGHHTNSAVLPALEDLLEQILDVVCASTNDWLLESASGPSQIQFVEGGSTFPGVRVSITRPVQIVS
jgi:hypothetical protein